MRLGDVANAGAAGVGQAARRRARARPRADAGAPLRHPAAGPPRRRRGEGRAPDGRRPRAAASLPAMADPEGRTRRRHLPAQQPQQAQRSASTSRRPTGRDLVLALAPRFDVVAENFKAGRHGPPRPRLRRHRRRAPGGDLPVGVGLREHGRRRRTTRGRRSRRSSRPCRASTSSSAGATTRRWSRPVGALGDIGSGLFAVDRRARRAAPPRRAPGEGQHVDIAMLDAHGRHDRHRHQLLVAGPAGRRRSAPLIMHGFRAVGRLVHRPGRPRAPVRRAGRARRPARSGSTTRASPTARAGSTTSRTSSARPSRRGRRTRRSLEACAGAVGAPASPPGRASPTTRSSPTRTSPPATCSSRCPAPTASTQPVLVPGNPVKLSERGRGPRDPGALARRAHRRGAGRRARPDRRTSWPTLRDDGVIA